MKILAIDPGTEQSGWVYLNDGEIYASGVNDNHDVIHPVQHSDSDILAIEMIASYGMSVGASTFETCVWIGRFIQAWGDDKTVRLIYRKDVKIHLCGTMKAKDANIRQALIDKLGPVGTAKNKGPLYGVKSHAWSALAVAVTAEGI